MTVNCGCKLLEQNTTEFKTLPPSIKAGPNSPLLKPNWLLFFFHILQNWVIFAVYNKLLILLLCSQILNKLFFYNNNLVITLLLQLILLEA